MLRYLLGLGAATAAFLLATPSSTLSDPSLEVPDTLKTSEGSISTSLRGAAGTAPAAAGVTSGKTELSGAAAEPRLESWTKGLSIRRIRVAAPGGMPGASEPDLGLDPHDPAQMAMSVTASRLTEEGQVPYPVFFSSDGGKRWERSVGQGPFRIADPGLEFDAEGRIFLSALDASADGASRGVVVARSGDAGRSFAPAVFALDDSTSFLFTDGIRRPACNATGGPLFDYPKLAADRSAGSPHRGALYLVALAQGFDRDNDGVCDGAAYVFIRSTDGGVTWEEARALDWIRLHTNHVAVGPDGAIYVAQAVDGNGPGGRRPGIWILKSVDGGATFLSPVPAYESADLEPAATWMAADPADPARVFVAFEGRDQEEIGHVYVQRSMDGGSTWGTPVRVDDSGGEDGDGEALRPTIAVAEGGRVDIAWFDYRRSRPARLVDNRQIGDVYFATSPDGAAWSRSLRLSGASAPLIFAPGNAFLTLVAAPDRALAVYAQDTDADNLYETWLAEIRPR